MAALLRGTDGLRIGESGGRRTDMGGEVGGWSEGHQTVVGGAAAAVV